MGDFHYFDTMQSTMECLNDLQTTYTKFVGVQTFSNSVEKKPITHNRHFSKHFNTIMGVNSPTHNRFNAQGNKFIKSASWARFLLKPPVG